MPLGDDQYVLSARVREAKVRGALVAVASHQKRNVRRLEWKVTPTNTLGNLLNRCGDGLILHGFCLPRSPCLHELDASAANLGQALLLCPDVAHLRVVSFGAVGRQSRCRQRGNQQCVQALPLGITLKIWVLCCNLLLDRRAALVVRVPLVIRHLRPSGGECRHQVNCVPAVVRRAGGAFQACQRLVSVLRPFSPARHYKVVEAAEAGLQRRGWFGPYLALSHGCRH